MKAFVEAVAYNSPDAFIHIISNPANSIEPIAAEVLKDYCFIPIVKDNSVTFTYEEVQEVTVRIQNAGTEVVDAKAGAGSATLSMSDLTYLPFFASRVKLGKNGAEALISLDLQGLTEYEQKALEALKPELNASIEKGVAFLQKQPPSA
ncbi:malate dehydrogenase, chloroplastic-like [Olea europaea subsp. europaea]|uniref:Malate dehydrogenase, chloroplastic-like n=1 Tax=Olea europaea subsp. europaea TaxID=158383 RepID=A0A8S0PDQ6_OLEEU|nr:malate dehydrogenase, chloroplastic-like [Olea europaea subsp. europaea]